MTYTPPDLNEGWSFFALGTPAPQGSKVRTKFGMREASKAVAPWRDTVTSAAFGAGVPISGPVALRMVFTMPRPKSAPKRRAYFPAVAPDWDKLARAVGDSVTAAGLWEDDGRVVEASVTKLAVGDADALPVPGVVIAACPVADIGRERDFEMVVSIRLDRLAEKALTAARTKYRAVAS